MNITEREWWHKLPSRLNLRREGYASWVARPEWRYRKNILRLLQYRGFLASNLYAAFWMLYLTHTLQVPLKLAFDLVALTFMLSIGAEFPTGYLADRFGRRGSMLVGTAMCMVGLGVCASATHGDYWIVVPGLIIDEIGSSIAAGPDDGMANETASLLAGKRTAGEIRADYNHRRINYVALFRTAGGLIGGLLAVRIGLRSTVWAQVIAYGLAFYCAYCVVAEKKPKTSKRAVQSLKEVRKQQDMRKTEALGSMWQTARKIITDREIVATILYAGSMLGLLQFSYNFMSIYFSKVQLHGTALSIGYFGIVWSAFMVSPWVFKKSGLAGRFKKLFTGHERRMFAVLALIATVSMIVAGLSVSLFGLVALLGMYFSNTVQQPETGNRLMAYVEVVNEKMMSSAASARQLVSYLVAGVFSLLTGFISNKFSFGGGMVIAGLLFGLLASTGWLLMTSFTAKEAESQPQPIQTGLEEVTEPEA